LRFFIVICLFRIATLRFVIVVVIIEMLIVVVDGGKCAEKETADVSEDGGATGRDASFGKEFVENAQGVVDALGALKVEGVPGELDSEVEFDGILCGMVRAEAGGRVVRERTALATGGGAMLTAFCVTGSAGGFGWHGSCPVLGGWGCFAGLKRKAGGVE
jgi:hypothetical protein